MELWLASSLDQRQPGLDIPMPKLAPTDDANLARYDIEDHDPGLRTAFQVERLRCAAARPRRRTVLDRSPALRKLRVAALTLSEWNFKKRCIHVRMARYKNRDDVYPPRGIPPGRSTVPEDDGLTATICKGDRCLCTNKSFISPAWLAKP
jgi:hypothetical protein